MTAEGWHGATPAAGRLRELRVFLSHGLPQSPQTNNDSDVVTMAGGKLLVGYHCQALFQALDNSYHATVHILSFPPYREDR